MRIGGEINDVVYHEKFSWDDQRFVIGISIGMAEVNSSCANSDAVINAADGACYLAKQLGAVYRFGHRYCRIIERYTKLDWPYKYAGYWGVRASTHTSTRFILFRLSNLASSAKTLWTIN